MGNKWGNCDFSELQELQERLEAFEKDEQQKLYEECSRELAARLLTSVIKLTPTGDYDKPVHFVTKDGKEVNFTPHSGKVGGTLKRGWGVKRKNPGPISINKFVQTLPVKKVGAFYVIDIENNTEYASYVEHGHRTPDKKGFVEGQHFLEKSEQELKAVAPKVLEKIILNKLKEVFGDKD